MLEVLIGLISGIVSAMGMGGGTILILCLTIFLNKDQHVSQGANLIFFIPTSIIAIIMNNKNKLIKWKNGIIIAIFGTLGAIIGANISVRLDAKNLKKYFGIFLLGIAIIEIYSFLKNNGYIFKKKRNNN